MGPAARTAGTSSRWGFHAHGVAPFTYARASLLWIAGFILSGGLIVFHLASGGTSSGQGSGPAGPEAAGPGAARGAAPPSTSSGRAGGGGGGKAVSPTSQEVERHILKLQKAHGELVKVEVPGRTEEGRPIYAVTLTDPRADERDKQHVLIVAGQHGEEESGRMITLALMDWLVSPEAAATMRKQRIVVMPNVSPDAAERDAHETPRGIQPNLDHAPEGPRSPEGKAVEAISRALQPDLFVDMHSRGGAGCSYDMVLYPLTLQYLEDDNILHEIAREMVRAGEAAGIPHLTHSLTWSGWGGGDIREGSTTLFHYRSFHSLVFLTETAEHNDHAYPAERRTACGLARLKVLLEHGNRKPAGSCCEGYPCGLIGMLDGAFVAVGRTAAERRQSRLALWAQRDLLSRPKPAYPEPLKRKQYTFACGKDLPLPVGVQVRCGGKMEVQSVAVDGRALAASAMDGYSTWQDACSTFIQVALPSLKAGEHSLHIQFR